MNGIAGVVSFDVLYPLEKLQSMLSWFAHQKTASTNQDFIQFHNSCLGLQNFTSIQESPNKEIKVALMGKLIRTTSCISILQDHSLPISTEDAALVATLFQVLGERAFQYLDGDFALALLDQGCQELFIVRDRTGSSDFFWHRNDHALLFSSSLQSLLTTGIISQAPDLEACAAYLSNGYISQDKTAVHNVNRLLPGYFLKQSLSGKLTSQPYWSFSKSFSKQHTQHFETYEELYTHLLNTIYSGLDARIKEGLATEELSCPAIFSGTAGSCLIEKYLLTQSKLIPSSSIRFSEDDEKTTTHTRSNTLIGPQSFIQSLIPLVTAMEMPIAEINHIQTYQHVQWCSHHNLRAFFDTGFENQFCHYDTERSQITWSQNKTHAFASQLLNTLGTAFSRSALQLFPKQILQLLRKFQHDPLIQFVETNALVPLQELKRLSPTLHRYFQPDLFLHQFYHLPKIPSHPAALFYLTMKTTVIDKIHTARNAIARAYGVTAENPFLDLALLETFASLDETIWASPDILPSFPAFALQTVHTYTPIAAADEHVFSIWMQHPTIMAHFHALTRGILVESGFVSSEYIRALLKRASSSSFKILYALIILEIWMLLFIDRPMSKRQEPIRIEELLPLMKR